MNEGARITGNTSSSHGGGVFIGEHGNFTMSGGEISGNASSGRWTHGGGVLVGVNGNFNIEGGEIRDNVSTGRGGGVFVDFNGRLNMTGGVISNNSVSSTPLGSNEGNGGGVSVGSSTVRLIRVGDGGVFTMSGGEIFDNATARDGGGVHISAGTFTMTGGVISGNMASRHGGGIFVGSGVFYKTGGTIHGFGGTHNDNRASGTGHAVAVWAAGSARVGRYRNTTAGPTVRMASATAGAAGGWEN